MRIRMFVRAMLQGKKIDKELDDLLDELTKLAEEIKPLRTASDRLGALVSFFNLTSPWHDRGLADLTSKIQEINWNGQYNSAIKELNGLQGLFNRFGRNPYGWNRTSKGETVTEYNVYLGNIFTLWTKTVIYWREQVTPITYGSCISMGLNKEYAAKGPSSRDIVVDFQARPFVRHHGQAIIDSITCLKEAR